MIYAFIATRASTPERLKLLRNTITEAKLTAGCKFYLHLIPMTEEANLVGVKYSGAAGCDRVDNSTGNVGQHVAFNRALDEARTRGAIYFLRLDDDVEFITKRWLSKLMECSGKLNDKFILSPTVRGLRNPPDVSDLCEVGDVHLRFSTDALGGVCRFHPVALLNEYTSDVRLPLGAGDATGIGAYCQERLIPMAYLKAVRVRHITDIQEARDPEHFSHHQLFQHLPYIPKWPHDYPTS